MIQSVRWLGIVGAHGVILGGLWGDLGDSRFVVEGIVGDSGVILG